MLRLLKRRKASFADFASALLVGPLGSGGGPCAEPREFPIASSTRRYSSRSWKGTLSAGRFPLCISTDTAYRAVAASNPCTTPTQSFTSVTAKLTTRTFVPRGMFPSSLYFPSSASGCKGGSPTRPATCVACHCWDSFATCAARLAWAVRTASTVSSCDLGACCLLSVALTLCASRICSYSCSSGLLLDAVDRGAAPRGCCCPPGSAVGTSAAAAAMAKVKSLIVGPLGGCVRDIAAFSELIGLSAPIGVGLMLGFVTQRTCLACGRPSSKTKENSTCSPARRPMRPMRCALKTKMSRG
mmetsp:Transcript_41928/g.110625  ORF Transcript_41928/g.110625 Transcript_41928/m.110625 type:complete len:299 (-) Transcript_41928:662-1558(-)